MKNKDTIKFPTVHDLTFDLPEQYCWTDQKDPEWFLLKDTGKDDPQRIIAFSTKRMISLLAKTKRIPGDGTFASVPKNSFFQLYSLHAQISKDTMAPAVFFLLPNKKMVTYKRAFTIVKVALEEEQATWSPNDIDVSEKDFLLDFEQGAIKALMKVFPNCKISLCYFHFCQSLKRAVQRSPFNQLIKENEDAKNLILMLRALPMIPTEHVVSTFELMCDLEWGELLPIKDYFEHTYIGKWSRKKGPGGRPIHYRKEPLFPPKLWNQFEQSRRGESRTTNSVEGWHRGLRAAIGHDHPTMWRLMSQFQSEVNSLYSTMMQIERGTHKPKSKMGIYKRHNLLLKTKTENWSINLDQLDYLLSIAKLSGTFEVNAGEFHDDELPNLSNIDSDIDSD